MATSVGGSSPSRLSVSQKVLMDRGIELVKNGKVNKVAEVLYRASSQSTAGTRYNVKWGGRG